MTLAKRRIAVIGGTGALGGGLALRWAERGHKVVIGSRSEQKAIDAAEAISSSVGKDSVTGANNLAAAAAADIVVLTIPFALIRN